jgi:hypothetical protein
MLDDEASLSFWVSEHERLCVRAIYSGAALVIALLAGVSARRQLAGFPVSNRHA